MRSDHSQSSTVQFNRLIVAPLPSFCLLPVSPVLEASLKLSQVLNLPLWIEFSVAAEASRVFFFFASAGGAVQVSMTGAAVDLKLQLTARAEIEKLLSEKFGYNRRRRMHRNRSAKPQDSVAAILRT